MSLKFPYIQLDGDRNKASLYIRTAKTELKRTYDQAMQAGTPMYQRRVVLDNQSHVIATLKISGEFFSINIYAAPGLEKKFGAEKRDDEVVTEVPFPLGLYSGLAYKHWLPYDDATEDPADLDLTYPTTELFHPTRICLNNHPDDFPDGYNYQPNERLNVQPSTLLYYDNSIPKAAPPDPVFEQDFKDELAQTSRIRPCQFSGLLQIAATFSISHGDIRLPRETLPDYFEDMATQEYIDACKTQGVLCAYEQHSLKTHGIVRDVNTNLWLVEISQLNGIIARQLPIFKSGTFIGASKDEEEAIVLLGGVPTGESFPNARQDILDGIDDGWIIEVMPPTNSPIEDFFDNESFYTDWGYSWAFNNDGTEARTTTYEWSFSDFSRFKYWSLTFDFDFDSGGSPDFSVTLTKLQDQYMAAGRNWDGEHPLVGGEHNGVDNSSLHDDLCVYFHAGDIYNTYSPGASVGAQQSVYDALWTGLPDDADAVVWVGWINEEWHTITQRFIKIVGYHRHFSPEKSIDLSQVQLGKNHTIIDTSEEVFELEEPVPGGTRWTTRPIHYSTAFPKNSIRTEKWEHWDDNSLDEKYVYADILQKGTLPGAMCSPERKHEEGRDHKNTMAWDLFYPTPWIKWRFIEHYPRGGFTRFYACASNRNAYFLLFVEQRLSDSYWRNIFECYPLRSDVRHFQDRVSSEFFFPDVFPRSSNTGWPAGYDYAAFGTTGPYTQWPDPQELYEPMDDHREASPLAPNSIDLQLRRKCIGVFASWDSTILGGGTYTQRNVQRVDLNAEEEDFTWTEWWYSGKVIHQPGSTYIDIFETPEPAFEYRVVDGGGWFTGGTDEGVPTQMGPDGEPCPTVYAFDAEIGQGYGRPFKSIRADPEAPTYRYKGEYEGKIWLVADRFTTEPLLLKSIPVVDTDTDGYYELRNIEDAQYTYDSSFYIRGPTWWCQTAVWGEEAAIYSHPVGTDYNRPMTLTSSGIMPPMPPGEDYEYFRLTFVGVNSE